MVQEGFLELINNMLASGMVPALYAEDERDGCINAVRDDVAKAGIVETKENCWNYFIDRCRDNLHVVRTASERKSTDLNARRFRANDDGFVQQTKVST